MTQNANILHSSLQHMWQCCFDNASASACSLPSISCCASASWKPHSVFPVKPAGTETGSGSERRSLLRWAGCEQLPEPVQLQCLPFPPHAPLICTAAASQALWAKAAGGQARSAHHSREVSVSVSLCLMRFGLQRDRS